MYIIMFFFSGKYISKNSYFSADLKLTKVLSYPKIIAFFSIYNVLGYQSYLAQVFPFCWLVLPFGERNKLLIGAPNDGFLFRLSRVLFRYLEMHSKRRVKFVSVWSSLGNLSLFEITKAWVLFFRNFRWNLTHYEREKFSDSSCHHIFESEKFRFLFSTKNSLGWKVKCKK